MEMEERELALGSEILGAIRNRKSRTVLSTKKMSAANPNTLKNITPRHDMLPVYPLS